MSRRPLGVALLAAAMGYGCPAEEAQTTKAPAVAKAGPAPTAASQPAPTAPASQPAQAASGPAPKAADGSTNSTWIKYEGKCKPNEPCRCVGNLKYGQNGLAQIGITAEDLERGTACLIGDFDGNGYSDLAYVDKSYGKVDNNIRGVGAVQVLMFDQAGLMAYTPLPKKVSILKAQPAPEGQRGSRLVAGPGAGTYVFEFDGQQFSGKKKE